MLSRLISILEKNFTYMEAFLSALALRNPALYFFGWACLLLGVGCSIQISRSRVTVMGVNAWVKPVKFFISSTAFAWTMGWLMDSLPEKNAVSLFSWVVIAVLTFENLYITYQAAKGERSHFNVSSSFHQLMFSAMGFAIVIMTSWTAYIGYLFCIGPFLTLPLGYLWGIRIGIFTFVIFAFEGGLMGAKLSHTVGAPDGGEGLPFLNWSRSDGDLRVAHFAGMHALQLLPILSFYWIRNPMLMVGFSVLYFTATTYLFYSALLGKPLFLKKG